MVILEKEFQALFNQIAGCQVFRKQARIVLIDFYRR